MSPFAFALVLTAALMHALWNAIVKAADQKDIALAFIALGNFIFGALLAIFAPLPSIETIPYLIATTIVHFLYYYLIYQGYKKGDLSQVYPIARGCAPVMVALGAQIFAQEILPLNMWIGIIIVSIGIIILSWDNIGKKKSYDALAIAFLNAIVIATYTVINGIGVRIAQEPIAYIAWVFILQITIFTAIFLKIKKNKQKITQKNILIGTAGGIISACAYGIVIFTATFAPLGLISTVRETSVIFAALIGVIWMKEKPVIPRLIAAFFVTIGVIWIAS